ncbi:phenylethanolamine N-methyltransferase-like [Dysidea avara]|uniref:phenylethanolamine N-methyltransferase-like n=1 Tax=Dysidea avara TaxID=196820 RepID=UPI0033198145
MVRRLKGSLTSLTSLELQFVGACSSSNMHYTYGAGYSDTRDYLNFYQTYHKDWEKSTAVLLEVGGGPCIYPLINAAPYVSEIYHSDYVKAFWDEVLMWKNNDPNAYDWSPYFKHIVQTLEIPAIKRPVNIISSNYCLESSFNSLECSAALKKIYDMLVSKDFFVSQARLENTWFNLVDVRHLTSISLSLQEIQKRYEETGFEVVHAEMYDKPLSVRNIKDDAIGYGFFIARKA